MLKRPQLRFVWLSVLSALAFLFTGCARPDGIIIASPSYLGTSAQLEQQTIRESIPPDLRKRLREAVAESQAQAASMDAHRQYLAQMPNPNAVVQQKLLEAVLKWAGEKTGEERLVLQHRRATFEGIVAESRDPDKPKASWKDHPKVQYGAGVVSGAAIGTVPLGPYAADVAIELRVLPEGTYHARVGKCAGELISGVIQMAVGCSGMTTGIGMTGTGGGAPAGIVVISASFALAANGYATAEHAVHEARRLYKEGPPPDAPAPAPQEQLLKPKAKPQTAPPAQPASAPAAKPAAPAPAAKPAPQAAAPAAPTKMVTRNKKTGEIVSTTKSTKTTTTTTRPKQAPTQAEAAVKPKGAKRGPKTEPDAPHNAAVRKEADRLEAGGNKIIAGGRRGPEELVKTEGGKKSGRRPDVIYITPDGQRRGLNIGKTKADGTPVKREQEALDDLNKHSDTPTDFVPYDR